MSSTIFDEYRERLERRRRKPVTVANFVRAAQRFNAWCDENGIEPDRATPDELEKYFASLELKRSTIDLHRRELRAAYAYALARGVIRQDPTIDIELPRAEDHKVRVIPNEHLRTAKANCASDEHYLMFHLFAYTGARLFEVLKMKWEDINSAGRTVEIIGKFGKRRLVPLHPALGEVVAQGGEGLIFPGRYGGVMSTGAAYRWLQKFCPGYTFHDFRRTVASSLDANGAGRGEIDEILGWASKGVFERHYRNVAPERLHRAILLLYSDDPL